MTTTTSPSRRSAPAQGPGLLGALALATEVADELVLGTAKDVHTAIASRVYGLTSLAGQGSTRFADSVHGRVSAAVYGAVGAGLHGATTALREADRRGLGTRLEASPHGRFMVSVVNGLIGDRLSEQGSDLAIELAVRRHGRDVGLDAPSLAAAFPEASEDVVVFLHGLSETEDAWRIRRHEDEAGVKGSYGRRLAADTTWTPVYLRANTGLPVSENGVALAALLDELVAQWPTDVRRIALVGHSMGGLIMRAACAVISDSESRWNTLVTDVVTLGTPHLGAPIERGLYLGTRALGRLPEAAPFGRILEYRSVGILDLRSGLAPDIQRLPHATYHLVGATLAASPRHPVSEALGDLLVRYPSAIGRPRRGAEMFPGADTLHIKGDHFDLLNHPRVYDALRGWLA